MSHPGMLNVFSDNIAGEFEWSKENFEEINKIIKKYPSGKQQSAVLPVLDIAQRQNKGYLNKSIILRQNLNRKFKLINYLDDLFTNKLLKKIFKLEFKRFLSDRDYRKYIFIKSGIKKI